MGTRRGGWSPLLLSRLALRCRGPGHRHAVRAAGLRRAPEGRAAGVPGHGVRRARVRLHGAAGHRKPLFPMYDLYDTRHRQDVVLKGMRLWGDHSIGFVRDCNWLQHFENVVDPWHLLALHTMISGPQFVGALGTVVRPTIEFEETGIGVRYQLVRDLPSGNRLFRSAECVVPNIILVPNIRE